MVMRPFLLELGNDVAGTSRAWDLSYSSKQEVRSIGGLDEVCKLGTADCLQRFTLLFGTVI